MVGPFGGKSKHTLSDFDEAVKNKDSDKLNSIMNDAWGRASESREVYNIPGFSEICSLLYGTVEGFIDDDLENKDDNDSAF